MPDMTKPFHTDAAELRRHYTYANNGLSCPDSDDCPVCAKRRTDVRGHAAGTIVVNLDSPKEKPWEPLRF